MFRKTILILLVAALVFSGTACSVGSSAASMSSSETSGGSPSTSNSIPTDGLKADGKIHVYIVGEGEKISTPTSSFIRYLIYYSESRHLIINMNGKDYVFANISSSTWDSFKKASSKGSFYNENIKGDHSYWINDYDGSNGDKIVIEYVD